MRKRASAELADSYTTFGSLLHYLRRRARLTQQQLGIAVGYSTPQISLLESGRRLPDLTTVAALFVPALSLEEEPQLAKRLLELASASRQAGAGDAAVHHIQRTVRRKVVMTDVIETDDQSARALPWRPPAPVVPLIGREQELAASLSRLLEPDVRLLTLVGPPGVGKTRLAQQMAWETRDIFMHGACWVDLTSVIDPGLVVTATAQALGTQPGNGETEMDAVQRCVRDRHVLLVIDNFEQVLAAAPVVAELLACAPQIKVLVTSREPLHLYGEHEYSVPALALPNLAHLPAVNELSIYPSIALFVARARAIRPDFALSSTNALAVAAICVRLDGLPLAIELAAAQTGLFTPPELAARLVQATNQQTSLRQRARNLPARHQTLADAIDWSYRQLSRAEQDLFACLGMFVGGFDLPAVEAVCGGDASPKTDGQSSANHQSPVTDLQSLVSKSLVQSLVQPVPTNGGARFVLLETLREYARERLAATGQMETLSRQHARYYLALAEDARQRAWSSDAPFALAPFDGDHDNMRAALHWLLNHDPDAALQLAGAIGPYWQTRGRYAEGRDLLARALRHPEGNRSHRARALMSAAHMAHRQSDYTAAYALAQEGIAIYRELGDRANVGRALQTCAWIAYDMHDRDGAARMFQEGLAILRDVGDQRSTATILTELAHIIHQPGVNDDQISRLLEESLTNLRSLGWTEGIAHALFERGTLEVRLGRYEAAKPHFIEALGLYRELGIPHLGAWALASLGEVAWLQGENTSARDSFTQALRQFEALQDRSAILIVLHHLGQVARRLGEIDQATKLYQQSLGMARELGNQHMIARCLAGLAGLALMQSRPGQASQLLGAAFKMFAALPPFLPPDDRAEYWRFVAEAHTASGSEFEQAWSAGSAMPVEQAARLAGAIA